MLLPVVCERAMCAHAVCELCRRLDSLVVMAQEALSKNLELDEEYPAVLQVCYQCLPVYTTAQYYGCQCIALLPVLPVYTIASGAASCDF